MEPVIDRKMLELLVCPLTGDSLIYNRDRQELVSVRARLAYEIRNGVPLMVASEARKLDKEEIDLIS